MKRFTLYCDPSHGKQLRLILQDAAGKRLKEHVAEVPRADCILSTIAQFVQPSTQLERLVVVNQAESFTFIRIVATVCNALVFTSGASLWTAKALDAEPRACAFIIPRYNAAPHIS